MNKEFLDLISVLDTALDEAEGGTHGVFYTLIILIDSMEKTYERNPSDVAALLSRHRFLRAEDWTMSTCEMGFYFGETITFMEDYLGMKEHEDYFVLYGTTLDYGIEEEEFGEKFTILFPKLSKHFDFIKVPRGDVVVRLKESLEKK